LDPDDLLDVLLACRAVQPQDADAPRVGVADAFDDFERRGLACAVGAEDSEDLAFPDGKRDAVDGGELAIALDEALDLDGRAFVLNRGRPASPACSARPTLI
jgi:hypothetical protein